VSSESGFDFQKTGAGFCGPEKSAQAEIVRKTNHDYKNRGHLSGRGFVRRMQASQAGKYHW